MSRKQVHNTLTLADKVKVIQKKEQFGLSARKLAEEFKVGKTQIQTILNNKRKHLDDYEANAPRAKKRCMRTTGNEEINELSYKFFIDCITHLIAVSGPILQQKALDFAKDLGITGFQASNGWLDSFKKRHNIAGFSMIGESGAVSDAVVVDWTAKLADITAGYADEDQFNTDETGCFWRQTTTKTLFLKGEKCKGGKQSKERVTVLLTANLAGEKEKPLVIGKAENPRCFKNIDKPSLPVVYKHNKKAWMTSYIFENWLNEFDQRMKEAGRNILLFLDNATCHPNVTLSNIKLVFLPPNNLSHAANGPGDYPVS